MPFGIPEAIGLGITAVSSGLGILQGAKADGKADDIAKAQYEYDMAMYEYDLEERDRLYEYAVDQTNIARNNALNTINFQEQSAIQDWKFEEEMSISNYNAQVDAYNKGERLFEKQVDYNSIAADIAYQQNADQLIDRKTKAGFDIEALDQQLNQALAKSAYAKASVENKLDSQRKQTGLSKALKGLQYRTQEAETAAKIEDSRSKGQTAKGRLMARGQSGNSVRKGVNSIMQQVGTQQARLLDGLTRFESQYKLGVMKDSQALANFEQESKIQINQIDTMSEYDQMTYDRGMRQVDESVKSAERAFNSNNLKIANDLFGANLRADAARRAKPGDRVAIPKPLQQPRPDIQDPYRPGDPPEPIEGAKSGGVNTIGALAGAANNLAGLNWGTITNTTPGSN